MRVAILFVLLGLALSAPVPRTVKSSKALHSDDGLLILVPTVPASSQAKGQPQKREVEYEVLAIPGEVLRREIRQIAGLYQSPNIAPAPIIDSGIVITPSAAPAVGGEAVLSTAGNLLETTGNNINSIGAATATNAGNVIGFISEVGQGAGSAAAEIAGSGLSYAGQLSGALLRSLLQVPAIKVRVIQELLQSPQPLIAAISDIIAQSSDTAGDAFVATAGFIDEAIGIVVRLVQDTLALKGRTLAAIGEAGLGFGDTAIQGSGTLFNAAVESGLNVFDAASDGVNEIVNLGSTNDFPAPPTLPALTFPQLPAIVFPDVALPDLGQLFPPKTPKPAAAPGSAKSIPTLEEIGEQIGSVLGPLFNKPPKAPKGGSAVLSTPVQQPTGLYVSPN